MTAETTLQKALALKNKITRIKEEVLADLEEQLKAYSEKLLRDMEAEGKYDLEVEQGRVIIVERRGQKKVNKEALMKALGVDSLKEYEVEGKPAKFVQYTVFHKAN